MAYTRTYRDFAGIDVSSEPSEVHDRRFAYAMNVWKDYHNENGEAVETAPGFRVLSSFGDTVHAIHYLPAVGDKTAKLLVHAGTKMHSHEIGEDMAISAATELEGEWSDAPSNSVYHYGKLYLVDGGKYRVVQRGKDGKFSATEVSGDPYVPTTFLNGDAYEQRNMLTPKFIEKYKTHKRTEGNETEEGAEEKDTQTFVIHEPVRVDPPQLYAKYYVVIGNAVEEKIASYYVYAGQISSGKHKNADGDVVSPIIVGEEDRYCPVEGRVEKGVVVTHYYPDGSEAGTEDWFYTIENGNYVEVVVSSQEQGYDWTVEGGYVTALKIDDRTKEGGSSVVEQIAEGDLIIYGEADPAKFASVGDMKDMLSGNPDFSKDTTALSAINGCTLIEEFDGRLFLSGNPNLPNSVFYTQRRADTGLNDPSYIGAYNYLNDGTGSTPIKAMISTPTYLVVLKDDVAHGSSAYYHTGQYNPSDDAITANLQPRVYPCEQGVPNVGCVGCATNFLDDPVFLSTKGLEAVGKSQVNLERSLAHRSYFVDAELINEDLRNARFAEWDGYLCILVPGGKMYLADSRQIDSAIHGHRQYEWYKWDGIGVHTAETKTKRYRYATINPVEGEKYEGLDIVIDGSGGYINGEPKSIKVNNKFYVASRETRDGIEYWFVAEWHGEYTGKDEDFKQATALLSLGGRLYFGCENGTVCMFTTNERDENHRLRPQAYIREREEEIIEGVARYKGLGYRACMATKSDHCGRTNVAKSTEKGTFVVKVKAYATTKMAVKVRADGGEWTEYYNNSVAISKIDDERFDLDFASVSFNTEDSFLIAIRERKRKWVEKQILFEGWCFKTPFGLISATYDFSVAGKVKLR